MGAPLLSLLPPPPRAQPPPSHRLAPPRAIPPPLAATAAHLTGTWLADYAASTNRSALLTALGLSGLQRVTAEKLIEGLALSVTGGDRTLSIRYLSVVPFFQVVEALPLDGTSTTQPRRDLRKGVQTASVAAGEGGGGQLVVTLAWPSPSPGVLVETYSPTPGNARELRVRSDLWTTGGPEAVNRAPPTASATTVYRREAGWVPRYTFPGGGGGGGGGAPPTARRAVLLAALGGAVAAALPARPAPAFPALPGMPATAPALNSPFARAPLPLFPRRSLSRPFAVILMRAPYDALADTLPAYPMAAFQSTFWTRRSDEWEPYIAARAAAGSPDPRPPQGDLTAPAYLDFISHSQWGALDAALDGADAMLSAPLLAEEGWADGEDGGGDGADRPRATEVSEEVDAARAAAVSASSPAAPLPDPVALRTLLAAAAGDRMLLMMREGFQGETFDLPRPPRPGDRMGEVRKTVQALLDVFVAKGYALSATASLDPDTSPSDPGGGLIVSVLGPAVLWGAAERAARGVAPNALDAFATGALFRAGGVGAILTGVQVSGTGITQAWIVGEGPVGVVVGQAPRGPPVEEEE